MRAKPFTIALPPDIRTAVTIVSAQEQLSNSAYVRRLILRDLRERGMELPPWRHGNSVMETIERTNPAAA